jgi:hypothetical protein
MNLKKIKNRPNPKNSTWMAAAQARAAARLLQHFYKHNQLIFERKKWLNNHIQEGAALDQKSIEPPLGGSFTNAEREES